MEEMISDGREHEKVRCLPEVPLRRRARYQRIEHEVSSLAHAHLRQNCHLVAQRRISGEQTLILGCSRV